MSLDLGALVLHLAVDDQVTPGLNRTEREINDFRTRATASAARAAKAISDARQDEETAARKVAIAEKRLEELRTTGKAKASQLMSAEDQLARAQQRHAAATDKVADANRRGAAEQARATEELEDAGRAAKSSQGAVVSLAGKAGLGLLAGAAVRTGLQTAAGMETARMGFTTMLGSAKQADVFLKQLADFAAKTPFEFPELQTAAQSLISAGVQADKVIPIMRTLGDVTAGMGTGAEGVERATVAIQQMNAAGRITAEDLNQLRDAGIPVYDLLAAATGRSKAEVAGLAQAGKLGKTELDAMMKALESGAGLERFNGLMAQTSTSLSGLWSTLQDTFSQGMASAIQPAIPLIKMGLGGAIAVASDHLDEAIIAGGAFFAVWSVQKVGGLIGSLSDLTIGFSRLSSGLGKASAFLSGPWGIAVGIGVTALGLLVAKQQMAAAETKAFTEQLTYQKGALDDNSKQMIVKKLADEGALEAARGAGIAEDEYVRALLAGGAARDQLLTKLDAIIVRTGDMDVQTHGNTQALMDQNDAARKASDVLVQLGDGLDRQKRAAELADSATKGLSASTGSAADTSAQLKSAQSDLGKAEQKLQTETQKLIDKFTILRDGALGSERASAAFEESLDGVSKSVKENGRSLDIHTEKGRANRSVVAEMISALNDKIAADFKANVESKGLAKATDIASAALETGKKRILDSADAAHLNTGQVKKMQDRMLLTPKELRTQVNTPGLKTAQSNVDSLGQKIRGLKDRQIDAKVSFDSNAASFYNKLGIRVAGVNSGGGLTIKALGGAVRKGGDVRLQHFDGGGKVQNLSGRPANGQDTEAALLRPDEHVWTPEEVGGAGGHGNMIRMRQAARAGRLQQVLHFAQGGTVSRSIDVHGKADPLANRYVTITPAVDRTGSAVAEQYLKQFAKAFVTAAKKKADAVGSISVDNPGGHSTWKGGTFSNLAIAHLKKAEKLAGQSINVYQGGFRPATSYSGTSHRGDALDSQPAAAIIRALRNVGWASGDRTGLGNWMPHEHAVPTKGHGYAAGSAVWQAQDYLRRGGKSQSLGSPWGLWTGSPSAPAGINEVAEYGSELVVNRQFRKFKGGERVFNAAETEQLFADAARGKSKEWTGDPLIRELHNHFPQSMDPMTAAAMAGSMTVAKLGAINIRRS